MIFDTRLNMILLIFSILINFIPVPALAKDLGVIAETYPIVEMNFMTFIALRITEMQKNGQWQAMQNRMQQQAIFYRDRPKAVRGISRATETRSYTFDPSIVLDHSIVSPDGRLIAIAGMRVNPLNHINLSETLIFLNGDDPEQIKWVISKVKALKSKVKLILVNGSLLDTEKSIEQAVYFDQEGKLTNRFHIKQDPALVHQQGNHLLIEEIKL